MQVGLYKLNNFFYQKADEVLVYEIFYLWPSRLYSLNAFGI
jgi:hypothetical protein